MGYKKYVNDETSKKFRLIRYVRTYVYQMCYTTLFYLSCFLFLWKQKSNWKGLLRRAYYAALKCNKHWTKNHKCVASFVERMFVQVIFRSLKIKRVVSVSIISTLSGIIIGNTNQPKYGLNLVDLLKMCFSCVHGCNYPAGIMFT